MVFRRNADSDNGLYVFGQVGWSDESVSEAETHVGGGLSLKGTFTGRDDDAVGVYCSLVDLSKEAGFSKNEFVIEGFYKLQLNPWASLKSDLQIITNPSGDPTVDTAVVGTIRFEVVF